MTGTPDFENQTKDAVAASLKVGGGAESAPVVPIICQHISHAARMSKDSKEAVVAVCRGAMKAVLLAGGSVPDTAVALMQALPNTSLMMRSGPEEIMTWVMEGVADVTPLAGPEVRDALGAKIEENFMGASSIFNAFCEAAARRGSA